jgi:hypothetical protein
MGIVFSSLAHTLRTKLSIQMQLGHVHQLLSAALGYKTYAAFKASKEEAPSFDDALHVVLDRALIDQRMGELGYSTPDEHNLLARAIRETFKEHLPEARVYDDVERLKDDLLSDIVRDIENSGSYSSEIAMTNAYGGDFELDLDEVSPVEEHEPEWALTVSGSSSLEQDPEQVYHGDVIDVSATVVFQKVGRRVLGEFEVLDIGAQIRPEPLDDYQS